MSERKKVVIAIPGDNFSSRFLLSWTSTLNTLWESGKWDVIVAPGVSSFVPFSRMMTLGLDVLRGINQKPFDGTEFHYWISLDSDIIYTPQQVLDLLESLETYPIVSGMYRMANLTNYAIVKEYDNNYFQKNGHFEFLTPEYVEQWKSENKDNKFMKVSYCGLGFIGIRSEVFKKLRYPYFDGELQEIITEEGKVLRDISSEDVNLCKNIIKAGYDIHINTDLRVGHLKPIVI